MTEAQPQQCTRRGISRRRFSVALAAGAGAFMQRSRAGTAPARMGTHGMVLFGGAEGLFGSHMPMFHRPHDLQVVLRLRAADPQRDAQLRQALLQGTGFWSIDPEPFDLDRAMPDTHDPLRGFDAKVYEGHFERDGRLRHERVAFAVERVLLFNRLDPSPRPSGAQEFVVFGDGLEHFLVKKLDQRPDVDLIGRFRTRTPMPAPRTVHVQGAALQPPDAHDMAHALQAAGIEAADGVTWLYTETGDLA